LGWKKPKLRSPLKCSLEHFEKYRRDLTKVGFNLTRKNGKEIKPKLINKVP